MIKNVTRGTIGSWPSESRAWRPPIDRLSLDATRRLEKAIVCGFGYYDGQGRLQCQVDVHSDLNPKFSILIKSFSTLKSKNRIMTEGKNRRNLFSTCLSFVTALLIRLSKVTFDGMLQ